MPLGAEITLAIVVIAVPPLTWLLSGGQRQAYKMRFAMRRRHWRASSPTPRQHRRKYQLLGAETQRSRAFGRRLNALVAARIHAQSGLELSNQFQTAVPTLLQVGFLTYAAIAAAQSGGAAAGAILYLLVPKVIEPVEQIIQFFGGLDMLWMQAAHMGAILDIRRSHPWRALGRHQRATRRSRSKMSSCDLPARRPVLHNAAVPGRKNQCRRRAIGVWKVDNPVPDRWCARTDSGSISIIGRPIRSLDRALLRTMVAVVSQSPLFMSDTVRANFQLARADASDAEIEQVARATGLWSALVRLGGERALDVEVPRAAGRGLSGGERRLLAVARVLLRQPKILLLDEPTTGVDQLSVGTLLDGLRRACAGLTVVMVEHNLDFVRSFADQYAVFRTGNSPILARQPNWHRGRRCSASCWQPVRR